MLLPGQDKRVNLFDMKRSFDRREYSSTTEHARTRMKIDSTRKYRKSKILHFCQNENLPAKFSENFNVTSTGSFVYSL